jgi:hypothetical protein
VVFAASLVRSNNGKISRAEVDKALFSASMVDSAISVCKRDAHTKGHFANAITYLVLDCVAEDPLLHIVVFTQLHAMQQHDIPSNFLQVEW